MKNKKRHSGNFRLDLLILVLTILLMGAGSSYAQNDLQKGIDIFQQKNYYGARKFFNDYLTNHKENAEAYYYLGRIAMEENGLKQATEYFDKAVDLEGSNSEYYTWKGIAYVQLLSTVDFMQQAIYAPRALTALEKAVELDSGNITARMWLAGYYTNAPSFAGGSEEKTKEQYDAITRIDPAFVPAYVNYGLALMGFEEFDLAYENFKKSLEYDHENYQVYLFIGELGTKSEKFSTQGEMALRKFIDLAPEAFQNDKDEAWWYLGTIFLQAGKTEDARSAYEKATALDPENEEYQKSLKKLM